MFEQLADVIDLLENRALWVATVLSEVRGVVTQDGQGRRWTALVALPRRHRHIHDLVDTAQRVHGRTDQPKVGNVDLVQSRVPRPEANDSLVRQFLNFDKAKVGAVAAQAIDPQQVVLRAGLADAAIGAPRSQ